MSLRTPTGDRPFGPPPRGMVVLWSAARTLTATEG